MPARPLGKDFLPLTNIPYLDRNNPVAFLTRFQEDFKCLPRRQSLFERPGGPQGLEVDQGKEAIVSYHHHPLPQITRTPRWTALYTNFKMQTDPREVAFLTTPSQKLRPLPFQTPPTPVRQTEANKKILHLVKLPESTYEASFTPRGHCPVERTRPKNLEGFPSLKWDGRCPSYASHYNTTFQGAWGTAAKLVEQHCSVVLGDPVKIVERGTTHAESFSWPAACRQPVVTEHLKLNLQHYFKNSWSTISREDFCYRKMDPVVLIKRDHNFSSVAKGDTDKKRNKERMTFTTNRISFPDNHSECSVCLPGADLMTKSHVQFGSPCLSNLYYSTTAKEHYCKQDGEQARPAVQLSSNLSGPEHKLNPSSTETEYPPFEDPPTDTLSVAEEQQQVSSGSSALQHHPQGSQPNL